MLEPNVRARAFYERLGFADDGGRQRDAAGWPVELRMRRDLRMRCDLQMRREP